MRKSHQRGFTLIEIMIVLALLGMILATGWGVFALVMKSWDTFQTRQEAEAAVRLTSVMITHELDYASLLEIRKENMWPFNNSNLESGDRIIYLNDEGNKIMLSEYKSTGTKHSTIVETERCILELSFKKPEYPAGSKQYLRDSLDYTVSAYHKTGNRALIYSTSSSIMTSNMIPGYGVPINDKSLYSKDIAYDSPGDRIRYNTTANRFVPSTPGTSGTCGL